MSEQMSGVEHVSMTELRERFTELCNRCYYANEAFVITKNGKPYAVLVHPDVSRVAVQRLRGAEAGEA